MEPDIATSDRIRIFGIELSRSVLSRVAKLAESMFPESGASIILVHERQIWRSAYAPELPREDPTTIDVLESGEPLWIADGHGDPRFSSHPLVVGPPFLRFCATTPVQLTDGSRPGALSVSSRQPQPYDSGKAERLADLAALVAEEWSHAQTVRALEQSMRDRDAALLASERAEERLNLALALSGLHVFELDYERRMLFKAGAEDTFFSEPKTYDDLYRDIYVTIHPEDRAAVAAAWKAHVETGAPYRPEYRIHRTDGQQVWAQGSIRFFTTPEGRPARMVGAMQDITERKAAERALLQATAKAEAASRAKSDFLATISHEIRTPLNGVLGMAQALTGEDLRGSQRRKLDVIRRSGEALLDLLNNVLDLSKIESGKLELEVGVVDMVALSRRAMDACASQVADKDISLECTVAPEAARPYAGDPVRVGQILLNLVSNAVKFTERGSVRLSAAAGNEGLEISVADTGIGIPAEVMPSLFEKFVQADSSTTRRFGGSGLGLAITRELVELMGGTIRAESEVGGGSVFTVRLPLAPTTAEEAPPAGRPADQLSPLRVLAAEDNEVNRLVLTTLLEQLGVPVTTVENGQEAVAAWELGGWDVILMDVQMPVTDGVQATREIRLREAACGRPRTPVVGLTANVMRHQIDEYLAAGMDRVLAKPLQFPDLIRALEEVLEGGEGTGGAAPIAESL